MPFSAVIYSSFMNPLLRPPPSPPRVPSSFSLLPFFIRDCSTPVNPSYLPFLAFLSAPFIPTTLLVVPHPLPSSRTPPCSLIYLVKLSFRPFTDFFQVASTCCTGTIDIMNSALFSKSTLPWRGAREDPPSKRKTPFSRRRRG